MPATRLTMQPVTSDEEIWEESDPALRFSGTWGKLNSQSYSGGAYRYSSVPNAAVEFTFTGRAITLLHAYAPFGGMVRVWLDGEVVKQIDMYGATVQRSVPTVLATGLSGGPHTVRVEVLSDSNPLSTGNHVIVDAFVVSK
jgi:hypothetical protein